MFNLLTRLSVNVHRVLRAAACCNFDLLYLVWPCMQSFTVLIDNQNSCFGNSQLFLLRISWLNWRHVLNPSDQSQGCISDGFIHHCASLKFNNQNLFICFSSIFPYTFMQDYTSRKYILQYRYKPPQHHISQELGG